ncbi:phosphotransferase family protein [Aspergillus cavernicola]|uniref:Phosphotransferase family protein n=1 Tax=Aspergillus cavernicola TaxID=176166 RepID=A0ABR4HTR2_9EURO
MIPESWIPEILSPQFTWPRPISTVIVEGTPLVPRVPSKLSLRTWGFVHSLLASFSKRYCSLWGVYSTFSCRELLFGLVLKWTERTSIEEVMAMKMARAAGMPVPKVISCGKHGGWVSILMTRLPGTPLLNSDEQFDADAEGPWVHELKQCLHAMRLWRCPTDSKYIGSVIGTAIHSIRVPMHRMGPFTYEAELLKHLLSPASMHSFISTREYEATLLRAKRLNMRPHRITFTHGDLQAHNILVDEGHLSGFLDWESGGWCPEYWEFTTSMRYAKSSWWYQTSYWLGGDQYMPELDSDKALNTLTVDSYVGLW